MAETLSKEALDFISLLNDLQSKLNKAEFDLNNGDHVISEYCSEIKRQVQLAKELKIQSTKDKSKETKIIEKIEEASEVMLNRINHFEKQALNAYTKISKDNYNIKIIKLKEMLNKWRNLVNNVETEQKVLLDEFHVALEMQARLAVNRDNFQSLLFNGQMIEFNKDTVSKKETNIGSLSLNSTNTINLNDFEQINLRPLIKDMMKSPEFELDNILHSYPFTFMCACLENNHTVLFIRDKHGINREKLYLVLLDENRVVKNKRFIHIDYAYFGFIRSSGNKICFSFGDDDIRAHLYVLDGISLEILHKLETAQNQLLIGNNSNYLYTSANREDPRMNHPAISPIYVYDWSLNLINKIGQRKHPKKAFYYPNYIFSLQYKNGKYYTLEECFHSENLSLHITNEETGLIMQVIKIKEQEILTFFQIDSNNRLVMFEQDCLSYRTPDGEIIKEIEILNCPYSCYPTLDSNNNLCMCVFEDEQNRKLLFKRLTF